ncbi:hypothetical protein GDO86_000668 [Hymenochirus boettgeri]|uniref:Uncharacterized protein n=1 Tax=Hymenochirus boettgeri TaxID=247094 RepID=A0A8T2KCK7_9PIPI|nr:hypothetical protein GDO86_000668 [Hymenochirus boettgeri]
MSLMIGTDYTKDTSIVRVGIVGQSNHHNQLIIYNMVIQIHNLQLFAQCSNRHIVLHFVYIVSLLLMLQ